MSDRFSAVLLPWSGGINSYAEDLEVAAGGYKTSFTNFFKTTDVLKVVCV